MRDSDDIIFKDEELDSDLPVSATTEEPWKILVVDDEDDVHNVTSYMLAGQEYRGRKFTFLHAYSAEEAKTILAEHPNVAVILLDVVMETDDSGLRLARYIREDLHNLAVRIILRTGQPGKAPATRVIVEYDINDYKEKTELTLERMLVTIISALRSYEFIITIENNRQGLKKIIQAASNIFERQSLQSLGCGVLSQLTAILGLKKSALYTHASGLTASGCQGQPVVLAATGQFKNYVNQPMTAVHEDLVHSTVRRAQSEPKIGRAHV